MPKILVDKPLSETNLKGDYSINLLIVKRKNKILEVTGDTILQSGDVIAVFGPMQNIKELFMKSKKKDLILEKNEEYSSSSLGLSITKKEEGLSDEKKLEIIDSILIEEE